MKKILISLALLALVLLPLSASAIDFNPPTGSIGSVQTLVTKILTPVWEMFIGLAVIMIIVAGIFFLTSNGNPEKIAQARMALLWAVVGIVVGILAFSITAIMKTAVGG